MPTDGDDAFHRSTGWVAGRVDDDPAGLDRLRQPVRTAQVFRPEDGGQAVEGVICDSNRLRLITERKYGQHRPENLFLSQTVRTRHGVEHCRTEVETGRKGSGRRGLVRDLGTFQPRGFEIAQDFLQVSLTCERPESRLALERIAWNE